MFSYNVFLESHIYDCCVQWGWAVFLLSEGGRGTDLAPYPSEADFSLIVGKYLCPQEYMLELALFLAPRDANENYMNVETKSQ